MRLWYYWYLQINHNGVPIWYQNLYLYSRFQMRNVAIHILNMLHGCLPFDEISLLVFCWFWPCWHTGEILSWVEEFEEDVQSIFTFQYKISSAIVQKENSNKHNEITEWSWNSYCLSYHNIKNIIYLYAVFLLNAWKYLSILSSWIDIGK